jgi:predicted enzyme related to lactoylglutathione lyase
MAITGVIARVRTHDLETAVPLYEAELAATLMTDDLDAQLVEVQTLGANVVAPATSTPNGRRAIVRHPDGVVVECAGR